MNKQCISQVSCVPAGWWEQVSSGGLHNPSPAEWANGGALIGAGEQEGAGKVKVRRWKREFLEIRIYKGIVLLWYL